MRTSYGLWTTAWDDYAQLVRTLAARGDVTRVCDAGGGANPVLPLDLIERLGLEYVLLDVSARELEKAPDGYQKVQADIGGSEPIPCPPFDLVVSKQLLEHVPAPDALHANIRRILEPGGRAAHFFPTLYSLPFVANRLLPERTSSWILQRVSSINRDPEGEHGKFRAYYRACRGPSRRQLARLARFGFEIEAYVGYFGHSYYEAVPPLHALETRAAQALVHRPLPALTSFAIVVLRRPALAGA